MIVFIQACISSLADVLMIALQPPRLSYTVFPLATVILVKDVQPKKREGPIDDTEAGIDTEVSLVQLPKAPPSMVFTAVPRVRVVRAVQSLKQAPPMVVWEVEALAKVTVLNEVQPQNAQPPTVVTELGMLTLDSLTQPSNAC